MADPPRSVTTHDIYSIFGISKDICKAYKSLFLKWNIDKSPTKKIELKAKSKATSREEYYKVINGNIKDEETSTTNSDPTTPAGSSHHRNIDDHMFFTHRTNSLFSRSGSRRRSKTPTPSPRSSTNNSSRRCTTPQSRSTSSTRRGSSQTEFPTFSRNSSKRSNSETEASLLENMSSLETEKPPPLSRNTSRRSSNTPIIFSQSTARRKPPPVEKKLHCTLEELCQGCLKMIKITRDAITNNGIIIQEEEILKIQVKPGWRKGTKVTFEGKGNEKPGYLPADIIFMIDEGRHPLFTREGDDLEIGVEIPLVNALTGCSIPIPLLGGEKMALSFDDIIYPGYEKIIPGQGMPHLQDQGRRGDLRIKFLVEFPIDLGDEQRAEAYRILQECV
ncbi:chaperone protein DnaJ-like [Juglans microcarpa x Juglans regia]|uniref:chaperone protein DnaJ-like n=1 Tax=Juglans microcarpa x Juglans regia TaxID=2249226 RepID=UPI001B7F2D89|nr:chaperone protein DnaJ-like [Juglans microcarpa x Juglans regia]